MRTTSRHPSSPDRQPIRQTAGSSRRASGYVVDVQANLLSDLASRVVVPLLPAAETQSVSRLNPIFEIDGQTHVLVVQSIATVPGRELRRAVTSLKGQHDTIPAAIDFLLAGF